MIIFQMDEYEMRKVTTPLNTYHCLFLTLYKFYKLVPAVGCAEGYRDKFPASNRSSSTLSFLAMAFSSSESIWSPDGKFEASITVGN